MSTECKKEQQMFHGSTFSTVIRGRRIWISFSSSLPGEREKLNQLWSKSTTAFFVFKSYYPNKCLFNTNCSTFASHPVPLLVSTQSTYRKMNCTNVRINFSLFSSPSHTSSPFWRWSRLLLTAYERENSSKWKKFYLWAILWSKRYAPSHARYIFRIQQIQPSQPTLEAPENRNWRKTCYSVSCRTRSSGA